LANQYNIPTLGFGTFGRTGAQGIDALLFALEVGYRHVDTAQGYDTERECGEAMRRSGLRRDEIFVTTKISPENFDRGSLVPSLRRSLDTLGLEQVDLALLHWPSPEERVPLSVYMEQLADAEAFGLTRLIGVSNFTIALLEASKAILGPAKLANNQVELNPHLQNKKLVDYCNKNGISITCYLPIARGTLAGDAVLEQIAAHHGASVEQIALAFELAKGLIAIPTSGRRDRILSNFAAREVRLTEEEIAAIETCDLNARVIDPEWGPDWD
jgi:2,5-diketo-D-gluconate reductase B